MKFCNKIQLQQEAFCNCTKRT